MGFLSSHLVGLYRQEVLDNAHNEIATMRHTVDFQLEQLENIAVQLSIDPDFTATVVLDRYEQLRTISKLRILRMTNDFIAEIVYSIRGTDLYVSSIGSHEAKYLHGVLGDHETWPADELLRILVETTRPQWRSFENVTVQGMVDNRLSLAIPVFRGASDPFAVVLFQVSRTAFLSTIVSEKTSSSLLCLVVVDSDGSEIIADGPRCGSDARTAALQIQGRDGGAPRSVILDDDVLVSTAASARLPWTYIRVDSLESIMGKVRLVQMRLLAAVASVLAIGGLLIFAFMRMNYRPTRNLVQTILTASSAGTPSGGDLEQAVDVLSQMLQSNYLREERIRSTAHLIRESLLLRLLRGSLGSADEFNAAGADLDLRISEGTLAVAVVRFVAADSHIVSGVLASGAVVETREPGHFCYSLEGIHQNLVILILSTATNSKKAIRRMVGGVRRALADQTGHPIAIGVGSMCTTPVELYRSYVEASIVSGEARSDGPDRVVYYRSGGGGDPQVCLNQQLQDLRTALDDYDPERFSVVMDGLIELIQADPKNPKLSATIHSHVSAAVMDWSIPAGRAVEHAVSTDSTHEKTRTLSQMAAVREIENLKETVVTHMRSERNVMDHSLVDQVRSYVREHYSDPSFCVAHLAERFGTSVSALSHFFRSHSGDSLSTYVRRTKISAAKQLLTESGRTVEDIAEATGYSTTSSFIRMFKAHTDVTPGYYRRIHRGPGTS
ncbi:MAG: AraC family transcriptional regulator [Spirochaetaceae bacterium]|nr:MAG: AraC family transcriptional regulator [Spirochaetaceae bacterium]